MMDFPFEPHWTRIPPVSLTGPLHRHADGRLEWPTSVGPLVIAPLLVGVRLTLGTPAGGVYPMLAQEPLHIRPATVSVDETGSAAITIAWDDFGLTLEPAPLAFELTRNGKRVQRTATDGHFVKRFRLPPFARLEDGRWLASLDLTAGEPVYGLGEKWGPLNKRGQVVRSEVFDALGVNADRAYKNVPWAFSPHGWGLLTHTPGTVFHSIGAPIWSHRSYAVLVEDHALDLFLVAGDTPADLIRAYTDLVGRAALPPFWSLGVILSKAYYRTAEEVLAAARDVRARGFPCDTITFDGRAWQDTDTRFHFNFDPKRYPDPRPTLDELRALDFHICAWEYPLVSVNGPLFAELAAKGWLLKDRRTGEPYRYAFDPEPFGAVLTQLPVSGLIDFTHPDAYAWWRDSHKPLFELGIDMLKTDFAEQVEDDCIAWNGDSGRRLHNVYPMLYNAAAHEAIERFRGGDGFLFGRAGWIGSNRYPLQWGGDPQADFEGFAASLRGGLSWGLSGGPFHATDIGGFYGDARDAELYVRWTQAAIFGSHFRFHGIGAREPWTYGPEAEAAVRKALEWRYRLLPYLWALVETAVETGLPVQRAMVLAFPEDRAAWAFEGQFMLGEDLLVAPALQPGGEVEVYLPAGTWTRFPDGETIPGGGVNRFTLALDEWAVFAREGAVIPLGPAVQSTRALDGKPQVESLWTP
jgi:alpha-D-xyloside xylohydrolase